MIFVKQLVGVGPRNSTVPPTNQTITMVDLYIASLMNTALKRQVNYSGQTFLPTILYTLQPPFLGLPVAIPSARPLQPPGAAHLCPYQGVASQSSHPAKV
mmetsp:Transcript_1942/g.12218  ORF Transcript_1942/g.12218 Transcript_1942/m.12218 type:complete len:100 (+) Transcript_1942:757-1056(+)